MLINELNHRVRNILTLIRSLSRQSRATAETIDDFVETLEARIEAVANAHSLAVERPDSYVSICTILSLEAEPHDRVEVLGPDAGLRPDVAPIFALVVHELMTNAAKYGALSNATGRVAIDLSPVGTGLKIQWRERGGPPVTAPKREGFGSSLLQNAVPNELRGTIDVDYRESGIVVEMTIPQDVLSGVRIVPGAQRLQAENIRPPSERPQEQTQQTRSRLRCLLVEDSFVISMDTMRIMNEVGLTSVQTVMNATEAMQAIDAERPDFAVLDVSLSGDETSLEVAKRLLELGVPFAFVTVTCPPRLPHS